MKIERFFVADGREPLSSELLKEVRSRHLSDLVCLDLKATPTCAQIEGYQRDALVVVAVVDRPNLPQPYRVSAPHVVVPTLDWGNRCDAVIEVGPSMNPTNVADQLLRSFAAERVRLCRSRGQLPWVDWFEDNPSGSNLDSPSLPSAPNGCSPPTKR